jgi:predicted aspartyl protease
MCSYGLMSATLRILWVQCVLLASTAAVNAAPPAVPPHRLATTAAALVSPPSAPAASPAVKPAVGLVPQPLSPDDLLFACPTSLDHIGRVVASVMIDGKGPFRFIIDTGANHSAMSPELAAVLRLRPSTQEAIRVTGITGTAEVSSVPIDTLRAGDLVIANTRFPVIQSPIMAGADGILGAAGLRDETLLVDFRHNRVAIMRSRGHSVPWSYTRVWATRLEGGLLSIPGEVGDVHVTAIIDTGSQHTLGNLALYQALYARERGKGKYLAADVYGATKQVGNGKLQMAPTIDLGAIKIGGVALVFGNFHIFQAWGMTARPAMILGMDVLGTVNGFAIDFHRGELGIDSRYNYESTARTQSTCPSALLASAVGSCSG